jgi:hypothetical protein
VRWACGIAAGLAVIGLVQFFTADTEFGICTIRNSSRYKAHLMPVRRLFFIPLAADGNGQVFRCYTYIRLFG